MIKIVLIVIEYAEVYLGRRYQELKQRQESSVYDLRSETTI